jgi:polar amino acid transport system substrate-binding protein
MPERRHFLLLLALLLARPGLADDCTLNAAVGLDKPPYVIEATRSGLEIETFAAAAQAAGCLVRFQHVPPVRALQMIRNREVDAMLTIREDSGVAGHYSEPYVTYRNVALSLEKNALPLHAVADLGRYRVTAFQNARIALGPTFRQAVDGNPEYREIASQQSQVNMLFTGRIDVVVGDIRILARLRESMPGSIDRSPPLQVHALFPPTEYRALFNDPALRDRFNEGLRAIRANKTLQRLIERYTAEPLRLGRR